MAQETNIKIQVSDDGVTGVDLATLAPDLKVYRHTPITPGQIKYYRIKAVGDGVNTLDSEWSAWISINTDYTTEYKAVLNYAENIAVPAITTPSNTQNVINDTIIRVAKIIEKWVEVDRFYYAEQDAGLYDFCRIDWVNPSDATMLVNLGANPVGFTSGQGFSITGGNSQYFDMQFNPSTDGVKCTASDYGCMFRLFNVPATYVNPIRILGCSSGGTYTINIAQFAQGQLLTRFNDAPRSETPVDQTKLNQHLHILRGTIGPQKLFSGDNYYKDSTSSGASSTPGTPNASIHVFGWNDNGNPFPSAGGFGIAYLALTSSLEDHHRDFFSIANNIYNFIEKASAGVLRMEAVDTVLNSIYFPQIVESSKFPQLTTSKKYMLLYSTDHSGTGGGVAWRESDYKDLRDVKTLGEKGIIVSGDQSETPHLHLVPNDPNGEPVHLYYHPNASHPDNEGYQQTRLLTTAGGAELHLCSFTDRDNIFGMVNPGVVEDHTGYAYLYTLADGSLVSIHNTTSSEGLSPDNVPNVGKSTNPGNSYVWTRETSDIDVKSYMPYKRQFHHTPSLFFTRNGVQYAVGGNTPYDFDWTKTEICLVQCDGNFIPQTFLGNISTPNGGSGAGNFGFKIFDDDPDTLHIYYIMNKNALYHATWDLTNLD